MALHRLRPTDTRIAMANCVPGTSFPPNSPSHRGAVFSTTTSAGRSSQPAAEPRFAWPNLARHAGSAGAQPPAKATGSLDPGCPLGGSANHDCDGELGCVPILALFGRLPIRAALASGTAKSARATGGPRHGTSGARAGVGCCNGRCVPLRRAADRSGQTSCGPRR